MCGGNSAKTDRKETLKNYGTLENLTNTLTSQGGELFRSGTEDTGKASRYYSAILSGNPAAVMQAAAPEINAINKQADAQKKDIANFGNRTGGTNQITQSLDTTKRGQVADVISGKRGEAAGAEARIGAGETGAGIGATEGAGQIASNLGELASKNRQISQQIHDAAVSRWAKMVSMAFSFVPGAGGVIGSEVAGGISDAYGG